MASVGNTVPPLAVGKVARSGLRATNPLREAIALVRRLFESEGWYVVPGLKFGAHLALYEGSPKEFHSQYLVFVIVESATFEMSYHNEVPPFDSPDGSCYDAPSTSVAALTRMSRLATVVRKSALVCYVPASALINRSVEDDSAFSSVKRWRLKRASSARLRNAG